MKLLCHIISNFYAYLITSRHFLTYIVFYNKPEFYIPIQTTVFLLILRKLCLQCPLLKGNTKMDLEHLNTCRRALITEFKNNEGSSSLYLSLRYFLG